MQASSSSCRYYPALDLLLLPGLLLLLSRMDSLQVLIRACSEGDRKIRPESVLLRAGGPDLYFLVLIRREAVGRTAFILVTAVC